LCAVRELDESAQWLTGFRQYWCWLFLAMVHDRLGHAAAPRQFLEKARNWIDEGGTDGKNNLNWARRDELQTPLREAEALLIEKPGAAAK
jgi:hypothetical protein